MSYSALLAVGVPPLPATVANLVAAVACWPGSALTSRRELTGTRHSLVRMLPVAAAAAAVGAVLLLVTPPGVFSRVVPFLIAVASLTLLSQPWLTARAAYYAGLTRLLAWPLVTPVSIYAGYFGAGSGIMLLAILLVLFDDRLPEANALKNMLVGVTCLAAAVIFVFVHPVDWAAVTPLAIGLFGGSTIGPVVARRLPARTVRLAVAALGLALATWLWLNPA